jgi:hypothetical protein
MMPIDETAAALQTVGPETHFEISHPIDSADDLNDFSLSFGDTNRATDFAGNETVSSATVTVPHDRLGAR